MLSHTARITKTHPGTAVSSRRAARRQRVALERELAGFRSTTDRVELDLLIDAATAAQSAEVRSILAKMSLSAA